MPGVIPAGGKITIRELLQHRSGLDNYTEYPLWMDQAERSASIKPIDALRFAASLPLLFAPGSQWAYSNTNYIALGLVIEKVTGHPFGRELQQRILTPLALTHTELATTRRLPDLHDEGTNPNLPWAAGGIVSDAQDLARFFSALLSGHLVSRASLAKMMQTTPSPTQDGLGIFACAPVAAPILLPGSNTAFASHTLSKSVALGPAKVKRVRDLDRLSRLVRAERPRT